MTGPTADRPVAPLRGQRAGAGLEWARFALYGLDEVTRTYPSALRAGAEKQVLALAAGLDETAAAVMRPSIGDVEVSATLQQLAADLRGQATALRTSVATPAGDVDERPFRVVLMGRTMAGKSTLFELLSGGDGSRIGDGRQRYSRDSCVGAVKALGLEIVDTPGVGALDGHADFEAAFAEVPQADLILWVAANDATQEQTGEALGILAAAGKPLLVVLNCRADLDDEIGWLDITEEPERVFDQSEGHVNVIRRYLERSGGRPVGTLLVHAQAALRASTGQQDEATSRVLHRHSRVDGLLEALAVEKAQSSEARRLLGVCDQLRGGLLGSAALVQQRSAAVRVDAEARAGLRRSFVRKADRRVEDAGTELLAATTAVLRKRAQWHDQVNLQSDVATLWQAEAELIQEELVHAVTQVAERLSEDIQAIGADCAEDWSHFTSEGFRDLTGFGQVWFHRLAAGGIDLAAVAGTALVGAQLVGLLGSVVPGLGNVVGFAVGAVAFGIAGLVVDPVKRMATGVVDYLFRSEAAVVDRRRREVEAQVRDVLREAEDAISMLVSGAVTQWRTLVMQEADRLQEGVVALQDACDSMDRLALVVRDCIGSVDTDTARALLGLAGRTRAAAALRRATRWPGVGVALELAEPAFTELALFPIDATPEPLVPTPPASGEWQSGSALQVVLGLHAGDLSISRMTAQDLSVRVDVAMPEGIRQAWSALAFAHADCATAIDLPLTARNLRENA